MVLNRLSNDCLMPDRVSGRCMADTASLSWVWMDWEEDDGNTIVVMLWRGDARRRRRIKVRKRKDPMDG